MDEMEKLEKEEYLNSERSLLYVVITNGKPDYNLCA